ncbi:hypothetical protein A2125_01725 [Candidatus Woesebacteria bacterium GWB1_43_5]|uniref:Type 4 fimbrial biogenesis protein PilX N-terminal domain-containing protein n=1 Tax=Candidatus Woesebacteria bacterium GWB1_43_5 TaxID=1802474 RepID=A0A1F7WQV0_9BACT|nr:MAG: hypothetical protein A2125_01725 [Candidatus Woesebacteria bacterium GWB1_43_5]
MHTQKGQALLIVLLSMAVILTVVLSILGRSVTDVTITSREEEAIRAFSAAEAGIEEGLVQQELTGVIAQPNFEGASFEANIDSIGEGQPRFVYPLQIDSGESATVWFISHDEAESLVCNPTHPCFSGSAFKVCFGGDQAFSAPSSMPAVEVAVVYLTAVENPATAKVARAAFDSNTSRIATNRFNSAGGGSCVIEGETFAFSAGVDLAALGIPSSVYNTPGALQFAQVRFLYNTQPQPLGIDTTGVLPSQGKMVASTGKSGEATRKIEVARLFADLPPIFQSVVYSPGGITK